MAEKRPTWGEIGRWLSQRRGLLAELHAAMREDEDYRQMSDQARAAAREYLSGLPPGFVPIYPSVAQDAIQVGVNRIVSGEEPDVTITFPDGSFDRFPKDKREAVERAARELHIRWIRAACKRIMSAQVLNVAREMAIQQLSLGMAPLVYPLDYSGWPDPPFGWLPVEDGEKRPRAATPDTAENRDRLRLWERRRQEAYPWATTSPHPTWVFFDLSNDPPRDYILEEKVSAAAMRERYGEEWGEGEELTLTRVTYISEDWVGQWCDGKALLRGRGVKDGVGRNVSGKPWVQMAVSGMGSQTSDGGWAPRIKGSIRDGRGEILLMVKAWNWMAAMGEMNAFPMPVFSGSGAQQAADDFAMGGATATVLPEGVTLHAFEPPRTPADVYKLWDIATQRFAGHFGQPVLSGEPVHGEPMGSMRTRASMAGMPFEPVKVSLEQAWGQMFEHKLALLKWQLQEAVTVEGVTMRPGDVVDGVQVKIDLTPLTEEEKAFRRTAAQDDVKMGAMTTEDYIRTQRGIDDAVAVEQAVAVGRMRDALLGDPEVVAVAKQQLLASLGAGQPQQPGAEGPGMEQGPEPPGGGGGAPDMQQFEGGIPAPEPTLGSAGEAAQYVAGGAPPVALPRRGVQGQ